MSHEEEMRPLVSRNGLYPDISIEDQGSTDQWVRRQPTWYDKFFKLTERGSSVKTEMRAGIVTFITMAYILIVNAQVLTQSGPDEYGRTMSFEGILTATGISAAIGTIFVGLVGNLPFGLAAGRP